MTPTPIPPAPILIVIVNYRTPECTAAALSAIAPEVVARSDAHVVVVDNGSGDASVTIIEDSIRRLGAAFWCTLLPLADNRGFAAGNNAGIARYRDDTGGLPRLIWLLNPDSIAQPDALGALLDFMGAHPEAGIVGGRCLWPDGGIRHSAFRFPSPASEALAALDFGALNGLFADHVVAMPIFDTPCRADWVGGAHMMIRGEAYERLGPMDEGYFLYFEESDYCARAADAGIARWHVPASSIVHIGGQATGVTGKGRPRDRRPRFWFASRARFFIRQHGVAATHLANLLWLLLYPPGFLLARLRGRPRHDAPRLWRDFLRHYYGPGGLMYRPKELVR